MPKEPNFPYRDMEVKEPCKKCLEREHKDKAAVQKERRSYRSLWCRLLLVSVPTVLFSMVMTYGLSFVANINPLRPTILLGLIISAIWVLIWMGTTINKLFSLKMSPQSVCLLMVELLPDWQKLSNAILGNLKR